MTKYETPEVMLCIVDFETFWSVQHSLTKMNPIVYVMHPETEIQSVSIAFDDWPAETFFGEERIRALFEKIDWSTKILNAHNNSGFDALIAVWRFGIRPKAFTCTLAMARPFFGLTCGVSLSAVSKALKLPDKGSLEAINTKGKKVAQFTEDECKKMVVYNNRDTDNCRAIWKSLAPRLSRVEHKLIDMTTRMTVYPQLIVDRDLLANALQTELRRKADALLELAVVCGVWQEGMSAEQAVDAMRPVIMSQPQFANLLTQLGAVVPLKPSTTQEDEFGEPLMIPALAKKDQGMTDLLEHDDPRVAMAAATRLELKSSQLETRLQTFISVSDALGGWLPMPLNYCGATISWRMSGSMKMNVQNLPRVDEKNPKPTDALRQSILAPEGKMILVVDSSNIEMRVAHMLAGQTETIERLINGEDLYCWFASNLYGREITKEDVGERFIGKTAMLSLQYGSGWSAFQNMCRVVGKANKIPDELCLISDDEAQRVVRVWRKQFDMIAGKGGIWKRCDQAIPAMFEGRCFQIDAGGLCVTDKERIITPDGHWLQYPGLHQNLNSSTKKYEWTYGEKQHMSRLYGAHLFENLCLGGTTQVLTINGWKRIVDVEQHDLLWDGLQWVSHGGLAYKGVKYTIDFGGVRMTPDHEVLVNENWIEAQHTSYEEAASSFDRHYRTPEWHADSGEVCRQRRQEVAVGNKVRLWHSEDSIGSDYNARQDKVLRVQQGQTHKRIYDQTWHVATSSVCGVPWHGGQMQVVIASGLGKLWWTWNNCMQAVAGVVRKFLGRHGRLVPAGAYFGQEEEQSWLQQAQLPLGYASSTGAKYASQHNNRHSNGKNAYMEGARNIWFKQDNTYAPFHDMASSTHVRPSGCKKVEGREEQVYDLMNAGPRHRFTVRGSDGRPFLVHNCQHLARLIVMEQTIKLDKHYPVALSCHDEAVCVPPEREAKDALNLALKIFHTPPKWWPDLPVAAAADLGISYASAK